MLASHALDLSRLEELDERSSHLVSLRGVAPDDAAVSAFLAALKQTDTFEQVHLLFTERQIVREQELRSFGVRLRVRKPKFDAEPESATAKTNTPKVDPRPSTDARSRT